MGLQSIQTKEKIEPCRFFHSLACRLLRFHGGFIFFLLVFGIHPMKAQNEIDVYLFSGQGSDRRIFDSLHFDPTFRIKFIEYGCPEKNQSMRDFALSLVSRIDTTRPFVLMGVSLGGMICAELAEVLKPLKVILISSAKNRNELPFRYRFQKIIPLYRLVPPRMMRWGAQWMQPLVEPDRNRNKATFVAMLKAKEAVYMKRTVAMIIHWGRTENSAAFVQLHGSKDHTIPLRNIKNPRFVIPGGSHMMTLTRAAEIEGILKEIVKDVKP
jgi:pimeloyl-ACP methyl ester carboxylesterase